MQWRDSTSRYGLVSVVLHWSIVVGIIAQYFLAEAGEDEGEAARSGFDAMQWHSSLGMTLLALALVRLIWRLPQPAPAPPTTMRGYEIVAARAVHVALYVLLFAIPLSGWALATLEDELLPYFGLFNLPALRVPGPWWSEDRLEELHETLFNILVVLAALHLLAALKHHFFDRDNVLRRMLPGRSP